MKKKVTFLKVFICLFLILIILPLSVLTFIIIKESQIPPGLRSDGTINVSNTYLYVELIDKKDNILTVQPIEDTATMDGLSPKNIFNIPIGRYDFAFVYTDIIVVDLNNVEEICSDLEIGDYVNLIHNPMIGRNGTNPIYLDGVVSIEPIEDSENIIPYKGRAFDTKYLSEEDIAWLKMTDEEREMSEYYPTDLENKGRLNLYNECMAWGLTLNVENISPTGLTLVFEQKDFIEYPENDNWKLSTKDYYTLEKLDRKIEKIKGNKYEKRTWKPVNSLIQKVDEYWSAEENSISMNGITKIDVDWKMMYGSLSKGEYRIGKEIKVLRGPHDYDWTTLYMYFIIE